MVRRLSVLVVLCVGLVGALVAPAQTAGAAERVEPPEVKKVTVTLEYLHQVREVSPGTYQCATGVFAPFVDLRGWTPRLLEWTETRPSGPLASYKDILSMAPWSDQYSIAGFSFPASPGTHHQLLPTFAAVTGGSGSAGQALCAQEVAKAQAQYGTTATVSYTRSWQCDKAIGLLAEAEQAKKAATKALKAAKTEPAKAAAAAKLQKAKQKLKKAKKKHKLECPK